MSDYIPVEGHNGLVRDRKTGAIININKTEIEQARMRKKLRKQKDTELEQLKDQVDRLTNVVEQLVKAQENK